MLILKTFSPTLVLDAIFAFLPPRRNDEMGYISFGHMESTVFFQLVAKRYEKNLSLILTSNKTYSEWGTVLGDHAIAVPS